MPLLQLPDIDPYGLELAEEKTEDVLSIPPLAADVTAIECLLGETGLGVLVGDADADRVGGDPGGVSRGVLVWDANKRLDDIRGLEAGINKKQGKNSHLVNK